LLSMKNRNLNWALKHVIFCQTLVGINFEISRGIVLFIYVELKCNYIYYTRKYMHAATPRLS
jgi:hypothetical protein